MPLFQRDPPTSHVIAIMIVGGTVAAGVVLAAGAVVAIGVLAYEAREIRKQNEGAPGYFAAMTAAAKARLEVADTIGSALDDIGKVRASMELAKFGADQYDRLNKSGTVPGGPPGVTVPSGPSAPLPPIEAPRSSLETFLTDPPVRVAPQTNAIPTPPSDGTGNSAPPS